jgi:hypothetical protein
MVFGETTERKRRERPASQCATNPHKVHHLLQNLFASLSRRSTPARYTAYRAILNRLRSVR